MTAKTPSERPYILTSHYSLFILKLISILFNLPRRSVSQYCYGNEPLLHKKHIYLRHTDTKYKSATKNNDKISVPKYDFPLH